MEEMINSLTDLFPIVYDAMTDVSKYVKTKVRISKKRFKWKYIYIEGLDLYKYSPGVIPTLKLINKLLERGCQNEK